MTSIAETTTETDAQKVARFARLVADVLEGLPAGVEVPTHQDIQHYLDKPRLSWLIFNGPPLDEQKARAAAILRGVGGKWDKEPGDLYAFTSERGGVDLDITVERAAVCRRVVTGTREVTKTVPAPDAPMVEVTETAEDVRWECEPLLTDAAGVSA